MEWLVAGVFAMIGVVVLVVIWIGQRNPRLKPGYRNRSAAGMFGLGLPSKPDRKDDDRPRSP